MKNQIILLFLLVFNGTAAAQIITPAVFSWEKCSWGDTPEMVDAKLARTGWQRIDPAADKELSRIADGKIFFSFPDSLSGKKIDVRLGFNEKTNALSLIFISLTQKRGTVPSIDEGIEMLGRRFGSGKIAEFGGIGKRSTWKTEKTELVVMSFTLTSSESFIATYGPAVR